MNKDYLFGYGTLISKQSRKSTGMTGKSFSAILKNYERSWCVPISNEKSTALGIQKKKGKYCNGVLFEINKKNLKKFDKREGSWYQRILIKKEDICFLKKLEGNVWVYIMKNKARTNRKFPINQSEIDVILNGCLEIGKNFSLEFLRTTYGWGNINNDREKPKYPRALNNLPRKEEIDKLLEKIKNDK